MMNMPLGLLGLSLLFSIGLAVHVVRTGREMYWLFIILMFQPLGGLVYFIVNVAPGLFGGQAARQITRAARETLDPTREYREAKAACEDTPTVRNQSRLAAAAVALGKHDEAEQLYAEAAQGIHAEDPALLLGRANALLELDRPKEALEVLERLGEDLDARTPAAAVAMGRTYEALGRVAEARLRLPVGRPAHARLRGTGPLRRLHGPQWSAGRGRGGARRYGQAPRQAEGPVPPRRSPLARPRRPGAGPQLNARNKGPSLSAETLLDVVKGF